MPKKLRGNFVAISGNFNPQSLKVCPYMDKYGNEHKYASFKIEISANNKMPIKIFDEKTIGYLEGLKTNVFLKVRGCVYIHNDSISVQANQIITMV